VFIASYLPGASFWGGAANGALANISAGFIGGYIATGNLRGGLAGAFSNGVMYAGRQRAVEEAVTPDATDTEQTGGKCASATISEGGNASFSDSATKLFKSIPGFGPNSKFLGAPKEFMSGLRDPKKRQETLMAMSVKYGWNTGVNIKYVDQENTFASAENDGLSITFYRNAFYYPNYADIASVLFHEFVHEEQWSRYGDLMREWRYDNINSLLEYEAHSRTLGGENPFSKYISTIYASASSSKMQEHFNLMNSTNQSRATSKQFNCLSYQCDGGRK
jgi:hypothetical protein